MIYWIGQFMDRGVEVLREKKKTMIFFYLGYFAFVMILTLVLLILFGIGALITALGLGASGAGLGSQITAVKLAVVLVILTMHAISESAKVGIAAIGADLHTGKNTKAIDAIKLFIKHFLGVFAVVAISDFLLVAMGWFVVDLIISTVSDPLVSGNLFANGMGWLEDSALGQAGLGLLLFALFILGLLIVTGYYTWFSFAIFVIVFEGKGPISAIKSSFIRVRGQFFKVFLANTTMLITIAAIGNGMTLVVAGLNIAAQLSTAFAPALMLILSQILSGLNSIIGFVGGVVTQSVGVTGYAELYWETRNRQTGNDILVKIDQHKKSFEVLL